MIDLSRSTRVLLYLYSTRNVVASVLALIGPALLFAGVIHDYWLPITVGLYAAGFVATPSPQVIDADLTEALSADELRARLDTLLAQARPALPAALVTRLEHIRASIDAVLPKLLASRQASDDLFTVREAVLRYLPETLANYLALPQLFRTTRSLRDGKTAQVLLGEQLAVLDEQLAEVVTNVAHGDAEALLANGRFLESRFKNRDFLSVPAG